MPKPTNYPQDIQEIIRKKGALWSEEEKERVKLYLNNEKYSYYLTFSKLHLGRIASRQDAEDMTQRFLGNRINYYIDQYDPAGKSFWNAIQEWHKKECWAQSKRIKRRQQGRVTLINDIEKNEENSGEVSFVPQEKGPNPEEDTINREFIELLNVCLNRLKAEYRTVFVFFYVNDYSQKEIADQLNITVNLVGLKNLRAKQQVAKCLGNYKGYESWKRK